MLFTHTRRHSLIPLLAYVDDIVTASNDIPAVTDLKVFLNNNFKLKDLRNLNTF